MKTTAEKTDTQRSLQIHTDEAEPQSLDNALAWLFQDRRTPLEPWSAPKLHLNTPRRIVGESIVQLAEALQYITGICEEWKAEAARWQTGNQYRRLEPGETLEPGDIVYAECGKATIDRVTEKTAFAGRRSWPRTVLSRWKEKGTNRYGNDTPTRRTHQPAPALEV